MLLHISLKLFFRIVINLLMYYFFFWFVMCLKAAFKQLSRYVLWMFSERTTCLSAHAQSAWSKLAILMKHQRKRWVREKKEIWVIEDVMTSLSCKLCLLVCENLVSYKREAKFVKAYKKRKKAFRNKNWSKLMCICIIDEQC